ncbi:MAG: DMT family transporter [Pseudomonadota bacterium]
MLLILIGMACISVNDVLIKQLSGDYPLHQMIFVRSTIGIVFSLVVVQFEGGWRILRTSTPGLHLIRGLLVVMANMTYFTALAVLPLANATALFFVAPLMITLLSIPLLGEKVGARRIGAVIVGFLGVILMVRPGSSVAESVPSVLVLGLPVLAALFYALMQIMTRKLGIASKPSALAVYIQSTFIVVSGLFWLVAGDGRLAEGLTDESLIFLLREWVWPAEGDRVLFGALGLVSGVIGYTLSRAYSNADAAVIAPFEYTNLVLAVVWGWIFFGHLPGLDTWMGIALIMGSGIYVFVREHIRQRPVASRRPQRRH